MINAKNGLKAVFIIIAILASAIFLDTVQNNMAMNTEINLADCKVLYNLDGTIHSLDGNFNGVKVRSEQDGLKVIDTYREIFEVPENTYFRCVNIQESITGTSYLYVQNFEGFDISGTYVSLVTDQDTLTAISMDINREIKSITMRRLTEKQINEAVFSKCDSETYQIQSTQEIIVNNRLVYSVYVVNNRVFNLDDMRLFVDAATKEVKTERQMADFFYYDADRNSQGKVSTLSYGGVEYLFNESRGISVFRMTEETTWPLEEQLYGDYVGVQNLSSTEDELAIAAYKNLIDSYDWYEERYGRESYDNKGSDILCLVGVDAIQDNAAYWNSFNIFLVGEVNKYDKAPAVFLDVIAHEYTHAVFKSITGECLIRNGETEGIHEAYADIFGCLIDGDWIIAEGIKEGKALSDPSGSGIKLVKKRHYPERYKDEYWSYSDGHINGMLLTKTVYAMLQHGFTEEDIADIWYQSMFYGYSDNSTYLTVRYNVEKAARALGYTEEQIKVLNSLFEEIGITTTA